MRLSMVRDYPRKVHITNSITSSHFITCFICYTNRFYVTNQNSSVIHPCTRRSNQKSSGIYPRTRRSRSHFHNISNWLLLSLPFLKGTGFADHNTPHCQVISIVIVGDVNYDTYNGLDIEVSRCSSPRSQLKNLNSKRKSRDEVILRFWRRLASETLRSSVSSKKDIPKRPIFWECHIIWDSQILKNY